MTQNRTAISESVARACTESAGTVQALAEEVGVSYAALCSWSRGRRKPPAHRLRRLAEVLDTRAERLREVAGLLRRQAGDGDGVAATPLTAVDGSAGRRPAADVTPLAARARNGESPSDRARLARHWAEATSEQARITRDRAAAAVQMLSSRPRS
jgi:transcriptional regulator with XRE-family HTH domain